ncbi:MAG: SCO family protein [Cypionkella sp.]|uniref:SCO family protein n=1 Tax=Cypionkella sp. TaxID=2811411 RepID=UPI002ABA0EC4|nr:SCO family protein [Cypionkella sp.]MDZ4068839.1 SCO family protein [Tabrizicola sp.]MDZ4310329.1 SCO family protein [Cypionkella sp.]
MRLRSLQIILLIAATAAAVTFSAVRWWPATDETPAAASAFTPAFALADSEGRIRSTAEFRGKFLLVFFGFTSCPDVCPTTLSEVAQVMDDLESATGSVQPIFISIDPERDRRLGLADYTKAFHPAILGLAGSEEETKSAAASFKIFYGRENDAAAPDGYSMAHSPGLFLIGPDGEWLRQFTYGTPAADILSDLQSRL